MFIPNSKLFGRGLLRNGCFGKGPRHASIRSEAPIVGVGRIRHWNSSRSWKLSWHNCLLWRSKHQTDPNINLCRIGLRTVFHPLSCSIPVLFLSGGSLHASPFVLRLSFCEFPCMLCLVSYAGAQCVGLVSWFLLRPGASPSPPAKFAVGCMQFNLYVCLQKTTKMPEGSRLAEPLGQSDQKQELFYLLPHSNTPMSIFLSRGPGYAY